MNTQTSTQRITFSYNWNNKLDCACYTTLRLSGRHHVGDKLEVWMDGKPHHRAIVRCRHVLTLDTISETVALIDTGYTREECIKIIRRMYPKIDNIQWQSQPIYLYVLQKIR